MAGVNGRASAWVSTGAGKIAGSALFRRASAIRFLSARHCDISHLGRESPGMVARRRKDFLSGGRVGLEKLWTISRGARHRLLSATLARHLLRSAALDLIPWRA